MSILHITVYVSELRLYNYKTCVCCNKPIVEGSYVELKFRQGSNSPSTYYHLDCCVISCDKDIIETIHLT